MLLMEDDLIVSFSKEPGQIDIERAKCGP